MEEVHANAWRGGFSVATEGLEELKRAVRVDLQGRLVVKKLLARLDGLVLETAA